MRKVLLITTLLFAFLYLLPYRAYAHEVATDNTITAELHFEPNDNPIPVEQTTIHFIISDTTHKFKIENCNCILSISEKGKILYSQPLLKITQDKPSVYTAFVNYTFPNSDNYSLKLVGNPTTSSAFQPFTLSWNFSVVKDDSQSYPQEHDPTFIYFASFVVGLPIIGGIIIFLVTFFSDRSEHKSK